MAGMDLHCIKASPASPVGGIAKLADYVRDILRCQQFQLWRLHAGKGSHLFRQEA